MSHKLRIECSTVEESVFDAACQVIQMLKAINEQTQELKVFHDINRQEKFGHSWITVNVDARAVDILEIYQLKKRLKEEKQKPNA